MRVNYCGILSLEKVGLYYLGNLTRYCFITLAPGGQNSTLYLTTVHLINTTYKSFLKLRY
jgi:hypothetical protein